MNFYRFVYVGVGLVIMFFQYQWGNPVKRRSERVIETRPAFHVIVPGTEDEAPEGAIVFIPQKEDAVLIVFRDRVEWHHGDGSTVIPINELQEYSRDHGAIRVVGTSGAEFKTFYMGPLVTKVENALAHLLQESENETEI